MRFDTKTFLEITGRGGGPVQALGTAYGMPSCLINLGAEALSLLPTSVLIAIRGSTSNGVNRADDVIKNAFAKFRFLEGIIEYDTEDGKFRFVSDSSKYGNDRNEGQSQGALANFLGALGVAAGFAGRLYTNYNSTVAQINGIKECLDLYKTYTDFTGANAANYRAQLASMDPQTYEEYLATQFGIDQDELKDALQFKADALGLLGRIDSTIGSRMRDPELEPEFLSEYDTIISSNLLKVEETVEEPEQVFRLTYGPPKSRVGKFILSVDGLYFDSQTSGVVPALLELENRSEYLLNKGDVWKLEHDPNIGGRGKQLSLNDFKSYVNTILDPNIIDESIFLQKFYDADNLLVDLIGQKNRKVFDVSSEIVSLQNEGASQALISNLRQVMLSETSHYLTKINKRKKQIELAVKMPSIYGKGSLYKVGEIPINDFSYLEGINFNLDIEKQKRIVLDQVDVSGVVKPLKTKFTEQIQNSDSVLLDHLLISNIGLGNIVSNDTSSSKLSVTTSISTDELILLYNYLSLDIETTSSTSYSLHNSSNKKSKLNGQLIAGNPELVFDQGIGIPFLEGIVKNSSLSPTIPSSVGSFIRLPDTSELQDLFYNVNGATFDTWVHVPELDGEDYGFGRNDGATSGLYRLILANENVGLRDISLKQEDILRMSPDNGSNSVKGIIMGFTRDRRITQNLLPSNNSHDNPIENLCFFIAPTQSYDNSSAGFVSKSYVDTETCYTDSGWYNMKCSVWDTVNGVSLSSAGREFIHLAVTFDPSINTISLYCDGKLMCASSYGDVFGRITGVPSIFNTNSFEYNSSSMSSVDLPQLKVGPKLGRYFTPYILGGGYTDGMQSGNFMGGEYGGIISGLKGYLGSTKIYSRALSQDEILNNFNSQKDFFKNINVPNLMWEPIDMA